MRGPKASQTGDIQNRTKANLSVPNRYPRSPWEACRRTGGPSPRADGHPYGDQDKGQVLFENHMLLVGHRTLQVSFRPNPSLEVATWGDVPPGPDGDLGSGSVLCRTDGRHDGNARHERTGHHDGHRVHNGCHDHNVRHGRTCRRGCTCRHDGHPGDRRGGSCLLGHAAMEGK